MSTATPELDLAAVMATPRIATRPADPAHQIDAAWGAVAAANEPETVFARGGQVSRVLATEEGPRIGLHTVPSWWEHLSRVATWVRPKSNGDEQPDAPPRGVAEAMLATPGGLPILRRLTTTPVVAPDGRILARSGYDRRSGIFVFLPEGFSLPDVPERPSPQQSAAAVDLIDHMVRDFPFVAASDRATFYSEVLTPLVRAMIQGPTPLHLHTAPTQGTGKGLLAQVSALLATGRIPSATTGPETEDEWRKKITAMLHAGTDVVLLDNLSGVLRTDALASALTEPAWTDRILGQTAMVDVPITCTWIATGNNVQLGADFPRRTVLCRLDAGVERPDQREIGWDVVAYVKRNRAALLAAALTLVRGWIAEGMPAGPRTLGRFESWAAVVGGILDVAGVGGLLQDRDALQARDADSEAWRAFAEAWWETHQGRDATVATLLPLATGGDLLSDVARRSTVDGQRAALGIALRQRTGRVYGDHRLAAAGRDKHSKAALYRLEVVSE